MKRKTNSPLNISTDRAAHVLHILIAEGKLTAKHVSAALKRREAMIADLRQRLAHLARGAVASTQKARRTIAGKVKPRVKRKMTAARRAALKAHGQYLGAVRPLSKQARAKVKAVREKSGVRAAIAAAKRMAKQPTRSTRPRRRRVSASAPGQKGLRGAKGKQVDLKAQPDYQSPKRRKLAEYLERERPKPDKHGGSGAGRQQGGSGPGREHG